MRTHFIWFIRMACAALAVGALIAQSSQDALADTLHATEDAYIQFAFPDSNKGSSRSIKLKDDNGGNGDRLGFAQFDLSTMGNVVAGDIV